jgi:non-ribosomal peptide synthetase component E (peptide arylation enzyme)
MCSYLALYVCVCSLQITGRMDDVINVAGHRLATGEVENVLCSDELVSEAAVCLCVCVDVRLDVS